MSDDNQSPTADSPVPAEHRPDNRVVVGQGLPGAKVLGDLLRHRRRELKRRVDDVAAAVDVTPSYLRMLETGKRAPAPDKALKLLMALDIPARVDDRADFVLETDEGTLVVEFKHRSIPMAPLGGSLRELGGAVPGAGLSHWLSLWPTDRQCAAEGDFGGITDAELIGRIVQLVSTLNSAQLRELWVAVAAIAQVSDRRTEPARPTELAADPPG